MGCFYNLARYIRPSAFSRYLLESGWLRSASVPQMDFHGWPCDEWTIAFSKESLHTKTTILVPLLFTDADDSALFRNQALLHTISTITGESSDEILSCLLGYTLDRGCV